MYLYFLDFTTMAEKRKNPYDIQDLIMGDQQRGPGAFVQMRNKARRMIEMPPQERNATLPMSTQEAPDYYHAVEFQCGIAAANEFMRSAGEAIHRSVIAGRQMMKSKLDAGSCVNWIGLHDRVRKLGELVSTLERNLVVRPTSLANELIDEPHTPRPVAFVRESVPIKEKTEAQKARAKVKRDRLKAKKAAAKAAEAPKEAPAVASKAAVVDETMNLFEA